MRSRRTKNLREFERRRPLGLYILAGVIIISLSSFLAYKAMRALFIIENIVIRGNHILSEADIKRIANIGYKRSLLDISSPQVYHRLIGSPWIKEAVIRKELPDKLIIWVEEASPQAIIKKDGRKFLIDDTGVLIEELQDDSPMLLPLLEIDYENRELISEALLLLKEMRTMNISAGESELIVTGSKKEDLTILVRQKGKGQDYLSIKIGHGSYREKLRRLVDFAPSIREKALRPYIIDLRFNERLIVREKKDGL
ncbi:MAG: FtsQ-type POTRA domain-containing protein [Thermodesulfovibrionales bacterium]|nr:FtsQ-type POTRA domain-containing protein [Thermodesulfovibrionales bacterium]